MNGRFSLDLELFYGVRLNWREFLLFYLYVNTHLLVVKWDVLDFMPRIVKVLHMRNFRNLTCDENVAWGSENVKFSYLTCRIIWDYLNFVVVLYAK